MKIHDFDGLIIFQASEITRIRFAMSKSARTNYSNLNFMNISMFFAEFRKHENSCFGEMLLLKSQSQF